MACVRNVGEVDSNSHFRSGDPNGWRHELQHQIQARMRRDYKEFLTRFYPEVLS